MATRVLQARDAAAHELRTGIAAIQQELHVDPDFPTDGAGGGGAGRAPRRGCPTST